MQYKLHKDGTYVGFGHTGQRYEIYEGSHGTWIMDVCGYTDDNYESLSECFDAVEEYESQSLKYDETQMEDN